MLRTLIIDDQSRGRKTLRYLFERHLPNIDLVGTANSVKTGLEAIARHKPDLVFLDIEMVDGSGFDLLNSLDEINFEVIFVTAHDQYALQAFNFSALHYLLKPVNLDELKQAVNRAEKMIGNDHSLEKQRLLALQQNLTLPLKQDNIVSLPTFAGFEFVQVNRILRCEADGSYTEFYLTDERKLLISKGLYEVEDLLKDYGFFRVHKSHLVNLKHILRYSKGKGGSIELRDGTVIEVAVRKKEGFLEAIKAIRNK